MGRKITILVLFFIGAYIRCTPIITYPHEVGHYIMVNLFGGSAEITSSTTTKMNRQYMNNPLVRAAGYTVEAMIFAAFLLTTKRKYIWWAFAAGGLLSSWVFAFPSTDLSGEPVAMIIYIVNLGILGFLVYRKQKIKQKSRAPVQNTPKNHTYISPLVVSTPGTTYNPDMDEVVVFRCPRRGTL
jgi:membrane protease YdiL (CAAX protease family)